MRGELRAWFYGLPAKGTSPEKVIAGQCVRPHAEVVRDPFYEGLDARHADVLQYLLYGAASVTEIAAALGVDVDSVLARCQELEQAGLIELGREILIRCA
jgi:hypothetical protein